MEKNLDFHASITAKSKNWLCMCVIWKIIYMKQASIDDESLSSRSKKKSRFLSTTNKFIGISRCKIYKINGCSSFYSIFYGTLSCTFIGWCWIFHYFVCVYVLVYGKRNDNEVIDLHKCLACFTINWHGVHFGILFVKFPVCD